VFYNFFFLRFVFGHKERLFGWGSSLVGESASLSRWRSRVQVPPFSNVNLATKLCKTEQKSWKKTERGRSLIGRAHALHAWSYRFESVRLQSN